MFRRKQEVYSIKEFMKKDEVKTEELTEEEKRRFFETGILIPLAVAPFMKIKATMAAEVVPVTAAEATGAMYDKMLHAFDPLITLIQALAYPVAMVVVLGGAIMVMINQKEKGFSMMQTAGLGYVLVQMTPMVLNILVDAMKAV